MTSSLKRKGQPAPYAAGLETYYRLQLIDEIGAQGKDMGDRYRLNLAYLKEADQKVGEIEAYIALLSRADSERLAFTQAVTRLTGQIDAIQQKNDEWEGSCSPHGAAPGNICNRVYALDQRKILAEIDDELRSIGYDAAAHDSSRQLETAARPAEGELRLLEAARAALQPLEREIGETHKQLELSTTEVSHLQQEYDAVCARLAAAEAEAPDLDSAERSLHELLEGENNQILEVGAAQQKVMVLKDLKIRLKDLTAQREGLARLVGQYKQLERAFGKDGVPALLIEQALPEIESCANNLLDRLSEGNMSVRFATQAQFKDKKREDLRETLDILISDGAGTRDYELYSGGEAFRLISPSGLPYPSC